MKNVNNLPFSLNHNIFSQPIAFQFIEITTQSKLYSSLIYSTGLGTLSLHSGPDAYQRVGFMASLEEQWGFLLGCFREQDHG